MEPVTIVVEHDYEYTRAYLEANGRRFVLARGTTKPVTAAVGARDALEALGYTVNTRGLVGSLYAA